MPSPPQRPHRPGWTPLDLPTLEAKPKQIIVDDLFVQAVALTPRQEQDYVTIRGLIRTGGDLAQYYRRSSTSDILLKTPKVLHLHLGGPSSDAILYVSQYPDHVLLIRIDSHIHLDDLPPGKRFNLLGARRFEGKLQQTRLTKTELLAQSRKRLLSAKPDPTATD